MMDKFTEKGRKVIIMAREEAEKHQNDYLGTEHIVLALVSDPDGCTRGQSSKEWV
ncbi:MAG: hypothetical protein D084_Lepto4C00486G0002 [Leptospirillum sp. Group IV 'UBA BS']|nr:MAG: hypothetical protein D084_Lepto4C00486G0002 [Leptospirillum sp. Group IV 'UBA BS']